MALTLISTPEKTVNGILSNVNACRSQLPYSFFESDLALKKNYKVEIKITNTAGSIDLLGQTFRYSPKPDGNLFIDVGALLTEYQESLLEASIDYVLWYKSIWDGAPAQDFLSSGVILSVYAEKQLLDEGGSNMYEYLLAPFPNLGLELLVIRNPVLWRGFSRTISTIYDRYFLDRVTVNTPEARWFEADINKILGVGIGTAPIDTTTDGVKTTEMLIADSYYTFFDYTSGPQNLSRGLFYENRDVSGCDNLMYLGWVNSKGGFEQWMFTYDQVVQRRVEPGLLAESAINQDIEVVDRTKKRLPDIWTQQVILTAEHLTREQLKGLAEMKQSDYLVLYLTADRVKRIFVTVSNDFTTTYNTKDSLYDYSVQIEFPNNFDFELAKEY